eukprot:TRINITY_DN66010_c0_g1_i1.p1 TRINITY_DN66010_c0_g1~~TRINITY_DN66010_c0_g1_i1.p1  ORF type:complete len:188 (+),score=61.02 TRINITY_DN66010_c0_g1_i1:85-564(+)
MFPVHAAADLYGAKRNVELAFSERPAVGELAQQVQRRFDMEAAIQCPPGSAPEPFVLDRIRVYDEVGRAWKELTGAEQLHPLAQVFAFQPDDSPHNADVAPIPVPTSSYAVAAGAAPAGDEALARHRRYDRWLSAVLRYAEDYPDQPLSAAGPHAAATR